MVRLAHSDRGSGRPIVFLHGITSSKRMWEPVIDLMEADHRCVAVDLPGHGESPDGPYGAVDQAAAVHELVDALGLERALLVGHSLGGMTATVYGALYPARGIVNIDQPLHLETVVAMLGANPARFRDERFTEAFDEFAAQLRIDLVPEPRRTALLADVNPRQDVVLANWGDLLDGNAAALQSQLDPALAAIGCPYLALFADEPSPAARATVEQIPNVTIEVWTGLGHLMHLVDPQRFASRVNSFDASIS